MNDENIFFLYSTKTELEFIDLIMPYGINVTPMIKVNRLTCIVSQKSVYSWTPETCERINDAYIGTTWLTSAFNTTQPSP